MKKIIVLLSSIVFIFCMTITCFAASIQSPSYPTAYGELPDGLYKYTVVSQPAGYGYLYSSDKPFKIVDGGLYVQSTANVKGYKHNSGWKFMLESQYTPETVILLGAEGGMRWASQDVFYDDGTLYMKGDPDFQMALSEEILEVTKEQMKITLPSLGGLMKLLAVCGVGMMALLIGLPVLRKVLFHFLP